MAERYNIGDMRELKLGSTFANSKSSSFHTMRYDFKPASVDESKMASVDIGQNNQVTVTVPHLDGSGTLQTVFKGNQKDYAKECVLIVNKITGEITLEQLSNNLQVKKTRSENGYKPTLPVSNFPKQLENSTQRQSSKTKVTSGARKNAIAGFPPKHSPIQGSPTYPVAAQWSASHNQSSLASLPMIGMEETMPTVHEEMETSPTPAPAPTESLFTSGSANMSQHHSPSVGVISASSSSSSSDSDSSDSDSDGSQRSSPKQSNLNGNVQFLPNALPNHLLTEDLCLSESNSDSD